MSSKRKTISITKTIPTCHILAVIYRTICSQIHLLDAIAAPRRLAMALIMLITLLFIYFGGVVVAGQNDGFVTTVSPPTSHRYTRLQLTAEPVLDQCQHNPHPRARSQQPYPRPASAPDNPKLRHHRRPSRKLLQRRLPRRPLVDDRRNRRRLRCLRRSLHCRFIP